MVSGAMPSGYSDRFARSPDGLADDKRHWWCPNCGAVFDRKHNETEYKFCYNCDQRDALLIEMRPVGKRSDSFPKGGVRGE